MSALTWTGLSDLSSQWTNSFSCLGKNTMVNSKTGWFFIPSFSALQAMHCDLTVPLSKGWSHYPSAHESPLVSG